MVCVPILKHSIALSQLRCSSHHLVVEIGRHNNIERERRLCTLCIKGEFVIEDEYHFIFDSFTYYKIRKSYLDFIEKYAHNYVELKKTKKESELQKLSAYCYHAFSLRKSLLNEQFLIVLKIMHILEFSQYIV